VLGAPVYLSPNPTTKWVGVVRSSGDRGCQTRPTDSPTGDGDCPDGHDWIEFDAALLVAYEYCSVCGAERERKLAHDELSPAALDLPAIDREAVETSVTTDSESLRADDHDGEARATDGTYTTLIRFTRLDETTVETLVYRCHDGTRKLESGGVTKYDVEPDMSTATVAEAHITADPMLAVECAAEAFDAPTLGEVR